MGELFSRCRDRSQTVTSPDHRRGAVMPPCPPKCSNSESFLFKFEEMRLKSSEFSEKTFSTESSHFLKEKMICELKGKLPRLSHSQRLEKLDFLLINSTSVKKITEIVGFTSKAALVECEGSEVCTSPIRSFQVVAVLNL